VNNPVQVCFVGDEEFNAHIELSFYLEQLLKIFGVFFFLTTNGVIDDSSQAMVCSGL
jgi:hypothetical protein